MKKNLPIIIIALIFLVGVGILSYPLVSSVVNNIEDRRHANDEIEKIQNLNKKDRDTLFTEAEKYNKDLLSTVLLTDPFDAATYDKIEESYRKTFNVNTDGLIGYIEIPKIDVFLPIYHGTSKEVLDIGAGHLENTSFPVGGKSTHSVISAHSAYPTRTFFDYLPDLKEGDRFYIHVLDEVLTYQVDQIKTVLPDETKDLYVVDGKDYITLLTCTPYSINTHRLLVRGERVPNDNESNTVQKIVNTNESGVYLLGYRINYLHAAIGIVAFIAAVGLIAFLIIRHKNTKKKHISESKDGDGGGRAKKRKAAL